MRILVIEDDKITSAIINSALKEKGYTVDLADDGQKGIDFADLNQGQYSCIILDLILPDINGFDICKTIRKNGDSTPILILSAHDDPDYKVTGLNIGADDYLTKPFDIPEFLARIAALERRKPNLEESTYSVRNVELDPNAHEVRVDMKEVQLSHIEFRLLTYLMKNRGKLITRTELIDRVWNMQGRQMFSNSLSVHIKQLRKKIKDTNKNKPLIITIRGSGYKFSMK